MFSLTSDSDIETHIQDLLLESVFNTADEQARIEIKQITEKLINLTDQMNHSSYLTSSSHSKVSYHFF